MARNLITTQTTFLLLVLFVLAIFFYNVVHFSQQYGLLSKTYEDKLRKSQEEIKRINVLLLECQEDNTPCMAHSSEDSYTFSDSDDPPPTKSIPPSSHSSNPVIPILVMACNRDDYLRETLENLVKHRPSTRFPIVVSQGCEHEGVTNLLKGDYANSVVALKHYKKPQAVSYFAIAQHYGWALAQIFTKLNYEAVIVVEDDMKISPDFYNYFTATYPILNSDPTLYCVSSWNDNGMNDNVNDASAIYRTEVFPGLGWMMTKSLWDEIGNIWPEEYWDEFMRLPRIRKNRSCLFPEISRNQNIGKRGTSQEQFWDKISRIKFNEEFVNFTNKDLSYLYKEQYDQKLKSEIAKAKLVQSTEVQSQSNQILRVNYEDIRSFANIAQFFQIMSDEKEGMPRTSYKGIVTFWHGSNKVYLTPHDLESRWK